ncbi:hypothetical protein [Streptomyces sp. G45]|uniref:hypothetical protein n=1 Tax=Streptomyces sp. G45 TaxID=3406627 RepID=UPI003C28451A
MSESTDANRLPRRAAWTRRARGLLAHAARGAAYSSGSAALSALVLWWQSRH